MLKKIWFLLLFFIGSLLIAAPGDRRGWGTPNVPLGLSSAVIEDDTKNMQVKLILMFMQIIFSDQDVDANIIEMLFMKSSNGLLLGGPTGELLCYQLGFIDKDVKLLKKIGKQLPVIELLRMQRKKIAKQLGLVKGVSSEIRFLVSKSRTDAISPDCYDILYGEFPEEDSHFVTAIFRLDKTDFWEIDQKIKIAVFAFMKKDGKYKICLRDSFINNESILHLIGIEYNKKENRYNLNKKTYLKLKQRLEKLKAADLKNKTKDEKQKHDLTKIRSMREWIIPSFEESAK